MSIDQRLIGMWAGFTPEQKRQALDALRDLIAKAAA